MIIVGIRIIWYNRNVVAHGKNAWSVSHCRFKVFILLTQFDLKDIAGRIPLGDMAPVEREDLKFFSDGSWSGRRRVGGWAVAALAGTTVIRYVTGFSSTCESGKGMELNKGIIAALRLANELNGENAHFFIRQC